MAGSTDETRRSNAKFLFGLPAWVRGLVKPIEGHALIYADWSAQEFGIAAALSKDPGDARGLQIGRSISRVRKAGRGRSAGCHEETHSVIRERFKTACGLGVNYGMEEDALALRIGQSKFDARELLRLHHETFRRFWLWSDGVSDRAMARNELHTVFDWVMYYGAGTKINPRSIRNWPMQAHGAEMLRLACVLATERGLGICAPVHDALVAEARLEDLESTIEALQSAMAEASRIVLDGFVLRSEAKTFSYPDRFEDGRGKDMWNLVRGLIAKPMIAPASAVMAVPAEILSTVVPFELQAAL